jgi:hypothetical protein
MLEAVSTCEMSVNSCETAWCALSLKTVIILHADLLGFCPPPPSTHTHTLPTSVSLYIIWICRKLRTVLTNRVLRFLHDKSTKDAAEYDKFYKDYGMFLKEGIVTTNEQLQKASHTFILVLYSILRYSSCKTEVE